MTLEDLERKLGQPDSDLETHTHEESKYDPLTEEKENVEIFSGKRRWRFPPRGGLAENQRTAIKIGVGALGVIIAIALIVVAVAKIKETAFNEENVVVEITGKSEVRGVDLVTYKIKYKNNNRVTLKDAEILINYPENFKPEGNINFKYEGDNTSTVYIGDIRPYGKGEMEISGRMYAPEDYNVYMTATLSYTSSNFNSVFKSSGSLGVDIKNSPIEVKISAPQEVLNGGNIEYVITYKNLSPIELSNLNVKVEYPFGFTSQETEPSALEGGDLWYISKLSPGEEGTIKIGGSIIGSRNDAKIIKVKIGAIGNDGKMINYSSKDEVSKIVFSPLIISQLVNEKTDYNANLGEDLRYEISYKNDGEVGLRDVVITLKINSKVIDYSKLQLEKGHFESSSQLITWKASDFPELSVLNPGEEGRFNFEIPVKEKIDIASSDDKNFAIETVAKIDSTDINLDSFQIPMSESISNKLVTKLNSKIILETTGFYNDANIDNSGPIPPVVGEETTYAMHWSVTNISNNINNVEVRTYLPTGIKWKGTVYPSEEKIEFNERTNEIVWKIGSLINGTGILDHPKEVSFKIGLTPEESQVGKKVQLLNESTLKARDVFTEEDLSQVSESKTTLLREDLSIDKYEIKAKE